MWHIGKKLALLLSCSVMVYSTCQARAFTVTTTSDTYPTGQVGELRWAIQQSNLTPGPHQIVFHIPGTGPFVIQPVQDLDPISKLVFIDGYSQPGAKINTLATGSNAQLQIVISGNNYATGNAYQGTGNGLVFVAGSSGSSVKGLVINGWVNTGIFIYQANNINILGNFIGTNPTGSAQVANQTGLFIQSSNDTVIGNTTPAGRNIIAGSFFFFNDSSCIGTYSTNGTIIQNNYIGTDASGTIVLGNSLAGILCIGSYLTTIGGSAAVERNIIAGHAVVGISLETSSANQITGNYIGTDVSGTSTLGNKNLGIVVIGNGTENSAINNIVSNNLISGNRIGIKIGLASSPGANQNIVTGNLIGTDATGELALGNHYGVVINDNANIVGGSTTQTRNIISANTVGGVLVYGGAQDNLITGNYIGLDSTGTSSLPNGYGVQLGLLGGYGAAPNNTVTNNFFGGGNTQTIVGS